MPAYVLIAPDGKLRLKTYVADELKEKMRCRGKIANKAIPDVVLPLPFNCPRVKLVCMAKPFITFTSLITTAFCIWLIACRPAAAQMRDIRFGGTVPHEVVEATLLAQNAARRRPPLEGPIAIGAFDELVFGKGTDAVAARFQLSALLSRRIEAIDEVCRLTEAQRRKLELAGRGDIKRFLDRVEGIRKKDQRDIDEAACRELSHDGSGLRRVFTSGGPGEGSSFAKVLARSLTVEQAAQFGQSTLRRRAVGKAQPDRLSLGIVRVGATVEASVRIVLEADIDADIDVKFQAPSFLRITQSRMGTQNYGSKGTCAVCDVFVSLTTTDVGEFSGKLHVLFGEEGVAEVPVAATILEHEPGLSRVLIVETPFERFSTSDASIFDPWLEIVESAKLDVHYLEVDRAQPVLRELDLSNFDVVMLGGSGICSASAGDFEKLTAFVTSGGRVVVMANHFFRPSVERANEFIVRFGLRMADTETRAGVVIEIEEGDIAKHELADGVRSLKFHRPSPIAVENKTTGSILVAAPPYPGSGFVAVARSGKGEVVALGTSLWWNWIANERERGAGNAKLLENLLRKR